MSTEDLLASQEKDEPKSKFILGLDIGYGNVKMAYGYAGNKPAELQKKLTVKSFPATFQKITSENSSLAYRSKGNEKIVSFKDHNYVVFSSESSKLPTFADDRCMDAFYPQTDQYMVLFLGSLLEVGKEEIDLLVIGLPVNQTTDAEKIEYVKSHLTGTFQSAPKAKKVTVKEVAVIPQPVGAFFNSVASNTGSFDQSTLFCDIGFFSTDWVLMVASVVRDEASGSTSYAVSSIIDDTAYQIGSQHGNAISTTRFEDAIRGNRNFIMSADEKIEFTETFEKCSEEVVSRVIRIIKKAVRYDEEIFDHIIVVGGGAAYFEDAIKKAFPKKKVLREANSVTANATGFYWYGVFALKD